jgi:hypothetical protein
LSKFVFFLRFERNLIAQLNYLLNAISLVLDIFSAKNNYSCENYNQASLTEKSQLKSLSRTQLLFTVLAKNWILFNCLIQPTHNLMICLFWDLKALLLRKILWIDPLKLVEVKNYLYMFFIITQSSYFAQGNSNSLNTVQISSGLVGINYINEPIIAFLLISATYSSHVYWFLVQNEYLLRVKLLIFRENALKANK